MIFLNVQVIEAENLPTAGRCLGAFNYKLIFRVKEN